jgi:hypothetical protein
MPKMRSLATSALGFGALMGLAPVVRAQSFVEFAAGSNYVHARPAGTAFSYGHGFTGRASYGQRVASNVNVRLDADFAQFDDAVETIPPCAPPGCTQRSYITRTNFLAGLSVNALADLDQRGLVYLIGGAGPGFGGHASTVDLNLRISAGAGVAIPSGDRLRLVLEARWLGLVGGTMNASWLIPFTVGVRY